MGPNLGPSLEAATGRSDCPIFDLQWSANDVGLFFVSAYGQYHNKRVVTCRLANKQNLTIDCEDKRNDRVTLWLEIDVEDWKKSEKVMYRPGDHVGMFAANRHELVSALIQYLQCDQDPDTPMELQFLKEKHTSTGEITPSQCQCGYALT